MDPILVFFVFPLVTVVFSVALQLLLNNSFLVSAIIFAVYLVITFLAFTSDFLIFAIIYAIIALITALLTRLILCLSRRFGDITENSVINRNATEITDSTSVANTTDNFNSCINCQWRNMCQRSRT